MMERLLIEKSLRTVYKHYQELAIPIIFRQDGVELFSFTVQNGFNTDLLVILFGSVSAVTSTDLIIIGIVAIVVVATISLLYKSCFLLSFVRNTPVSKLVSRRNGFTYFHYSSCFLSLQYQCGSGGLLVSSLMTYQLQSKVLYLLKDLNNNFSFFHFYSVMKLQ